MKIKIIIGVAMFLPAGIFAQSQIINSWRDPGTSIQNPGFHKIVVAALIYNQDWRHQVEDYMVTLYPGSAVQSYVLMGDSVVTDESAKSQQFKSEGYDGIVILKQTDENTTQQYIPGHAPAVYNSWAGYWGWNGWGGPRWVTHVVPGTPDRVHNQWNWYVQVNVFSLLTNKLIYSANTVTTNPGGRVPLFEDVCIAVRSQMSAVGFLQ
jgi:hypothetical protein